jgi:phage head maturation protease
VHGGTEVGHIKYARNDAAGLYTESFVSPDDPNGDRTLDEIRSGAKPQQSVGFECPPGGTQMRSGVTTRVKAMLTELAAVPVGAYGAGASVTGVRASDGSACPDCAARAALEAEQRMGQLRALVVSLPRLPVLR